MNISTIGKEKDMRKPPDTLSLKLIIDDKPLSEMIRSLYYPVSPYVFSKIPADILGQVYEQFLGKEIWLMASHQAKVEYKPRSYAYLTPLAVRVRFCWARINTCCNGIVTRTPKTPLNIKSCFTKIKVTNGNSARREKGHLA